MKKHRLRLRFWGGTRTVTGSKYLIETERAKILVDCGLFQGVKEQRLLNWKELPIDAAEIDAVLITHGHLDHTGYLPLLIRQGFRGRIYATDPTIAIATIVLQDAAKIQMEDALRANREGYSKHHPALPLYDIMDVEATLPHFSKRPLDEWFSPAQNVTARFRYSSHILGATFIELKIFDTTLVFSGDVGRDDDPLMFASKKPEHADVLLLESTYGGRFHPPDVRENLIKTLTTAAGYGGTILIPSFAVERTQLLMVLLSELRREGKIPSLPMYLDSPMGIHVLEVFTRFPEWHKLSPQQCATMSSDFTRIREPEETLELAESKEPKIIIAGSGMATGGRVLTYFEHFLADPASTVILAGYQAEGTRGRALLDGATEIKMRGLYWSVAAHIMQIEGLSAHADEEGLLRWLETLDAPPEQLFLTHGEQEAARALQRAIRERYGWEAQIPELYDAIKIPLKGE